MQTRIQNFFLISTLLLVDSAALWAAWDLAYTVRLSGSFLPFAYHANYEQYRNVVLLALPLWLGIFALSRLYARETLLGGPQEYGNVVKGCLFGLAALIAVSFCLRTPDLARGWLLVGLVLAIIFVGAARFVLRRFFYWLRRYGWFVQRALIVGTNDDARAIARQFTPAKRSGVDVIGFVDDYLAVGTRVEDGLRVLGATSNLHAVTSAHQIDQVILVSGAIAWESFDQLLRGITTLQDRYAIKLSPGLYETLTTGVRVSYKNRVPLLEIERAPITGIDALLKGLLDWVGGSILLIATAPLLIGFGAALWLLGRRPIFDSVSVLGRNNRIFTTRRLQAVRPEGPKWERGNRLGEFLFATGLDKLPQLINVLSGHMSLVGPRPVPSTHIALYQEWLPNLLSLKPGLTGARASSAENPIALAQEMRLELYYARNYSIWLDLQILFQSLLRAFRRERVLRKDEPEPEAQTQTDAARRPTIFTLPR